MKTFLKYAGAAIGIQILFLVAGGMIVNLSNTHDSVFGDIVLYLYYPFIMLFVKFGGYQGESSMINPPLLGIPLGVLFYGIIVGLIFSYIRRGKALS
jgi:hypothetical protein